ncbi:MAG: GNAT family N-acetyltransferase [Halanaerobiales bacterium]|nr:GNAT family N-acetyltransferase [Halanaerobiales bacterium]
MVNLQNIKIIEYNDSYAESLADMWNASKEGFGGTDALKSENSIIEEIANSGNIHNYLAIAADEVVGFCSFAEYQQDEGAAQIPLLNVSPDYQGKKIGKALILQAVQKTIDMEWPRLDLFTWGSNTKAIPLYKKCGFFWENDTDENVTIHLMNFIPTVLRTEALQEYFDILDWYNDSKRDIQIEPDGKSDNGFEFYEYIWEKDDVNLRVEFCRRARGIRLIETDDYLISCSIAEPELTFGRSYLVNYELVNKTGKPLEVTINGFDNKNVKFSLNQSCTVDSTKTIVGEFYLDEINKEQQPSKTHPGVCSDIYINGKKATLKLGVAPKFPVQLDIVIPTVEHFVNTDSTGYCNVRNGFNEEVTIEFELVSNQFITFPHSTYKLHLQPRERQSISISYRVKNLGFYSEEIPVHIKLKQEEINFKKKITAVLRGHGCKFSAVYQHSWAIYNGNYELMLHKDGNRLSLKKYSIDPKITTILFPRIGLPFSMEFAKIEPTNVEFYEEKDLMVMKAYYQSKDFKGLELVSVTKLNNNGIVEYYYEINNSGKRETVNEIALCLGVFYNFENTFIPYEGQVLKVKGYEDAVFNYYDLEKVTENWLYSNDTKVSRGIIWSQEYKLESNGRYLLLTVNLGHIAGQGIVKTKPIFFTYQTFKDWEECRNFAFKKNITSHPQPINSLEMIINDNNPFITGDLNVTIKNYKQVNFSGDLTLRSKTNAFSPVTQQFTSEENIRETTVALKMQDGSIDVIELLVDFETYELNRQSLVLKTNGDITEQVLQDNGIDVYVVDNGVLKFKSAPDFAGSIYSLNYKGHEYLDSSYPTPTMKHPWNPWVGGLAWHMGDMNFASLLNEKSTAEFTKLCDHLGNEWSGLKLKMKIEANPQFAGLEIHQYYLTMPGLPLMVTTAEVIQNTGYYFNDQQISHEGFLKLDEDIKNTWFSAKNRNDELVKYKAGRVSQGTEAIDSTVIYGGANREASLFIYALDAWGVDGFNNMEINANFIQQFISLGDGDRVFTAPIFLILSQDEIKSSLLKSLKNIKFR